MSKSEFERERKDKLSMLLLIKLKGPKRQVTWSQQQQWRHHHHHNNNDGSSGTTTKTADDQNLLKSIWMTSHSIPSLREQVASSTLSVLDHITVKWRTLH
jgi:hypothetical protein